MNEDTVILSDDDEEKVQNEKTHVEMVPATETIVLDDESGSEDEVQVTSIDANSTNICYVKNMSSKEKKLVNMLKGNALMDKIVKICLNMETAVGMPRVINKTLLPLYKDANHNLKSSPSFRKLLKRTLKHLKIDPDHKFLHLKTLCETIKSGNIKRKVPFVTLATNLKHNRIVENNTEVISIPNCFVIDNAHEVNININTYDAPTEVSNQSGREINNHRSTTKPPERYNYPKKRCKRTYGNIMSNRKKKNMNNTEDVEIIDLENSDTECVSNVNNQETESNNNEEENSNKENSITSQDDTNPNINAGTNLVDGHLTNVGNSDNELLIPSSYLEITMKKEDNSAKIRKLEETIRVYKKKIAELEEAEVDNDSFKSPYIQCNNFKLKLIQCYKELSRLNGFSGDIAKRREIRISVGEGRTSGPAKLLEKRLNYSIDSTGTVELPDFCDVVECVHIFNLTDNCGWSKKEVLTRATTLFRCCGEALRKNRQKREYKDMLGWVPQEAQMEDPAENDPRLQATLEENKLIAQAKEQEILEKYVNIENNLFPEKTVSTPMEFDFHQTSSDSESENTAAISNNAESQGNTEAMNQGALEKVLVNGNNSFSNIRQFASCLPDNSLANQNSLTEHKKTDKNDEAILKVNNSSICNTSITNILQDNSRVDPYIVIMEDPKDCPPNKTILQEHNPINNISISDKTVQLTHVILSDSNSVSKNPNDIDVQNSDRASVPSPIRIVKVEKYVPRIEFVDPDDTPVTEETDGCKIKLEPVDVQSMLDELGDGFVSTVFDVQDPFLVIEISSDDSSNDES